MHRTPLSPSGHGNSWAQRSTCGVSSPQDFWSKWRSNKSATWKHRPFDLGPAGSESASPSIHGPSLVTPVPGSRCCNLGRQGDPNPGHSPALDGWLNGRDPGLAGDGMYHYANMHQHLLYFEGIGGNLAAMARFPRSCDGAAPPSSRASENRCADLGRPTYTFYIFFF